MNQQLMKNLFQQIMKFKYSNDVIYKMPYNKNKNNIFKIDYCINGCVSFINDYKANIRCPNCNEPRFKKCNRDKCGEKRFVNNVDPYDSCDHSFIYRTPISCAFYISSLFYIFILYFINNY